MLDFGIDWSSIWRHLFLLSIAFLLALPSGWNREMREHSAGLRTFPLVSVAACSFMLIGIEVFSEELAQARVMGGILTGIGFIGGGAIIKSERNVTGTATAASIWATGALGIAVAWQRYEIAILLGILVYLILNYISKVKDRIRRKEER
jgi:putative Mg2+ transporter-C (MgtC) family protein